LFSSQASDVIFGVGDLSYSDPNSAKNLVINVDLIFHILTNYIEKYSQNGLKERKLCIRFDTTAADP